VPELNVGKLKMNFIEYVAGGLIISALIIAIAKIKKQRSWISTEAHVHSLGTEKPGESVEEPIEPMYSPILHFTAKSGVKVYEEKFGSEFGPALVGEKRRVLYNPCDPKIFCSANPIRRFLLEIGLLLIGIFLLLVSKFTS